MHNAFLWILLIIGVCAAQGATIKSQETKVSVTPATGKKSYSTNFDGGSLQSPVSLSVVESGTWVNCGISGFWQDVVVGGGLAFSKDFVSGYNDACAHLTGFSANHSVEGVVHFRPGYVATGTHEILLLLRLQATSSSVRGYEVNIWFGGGAVQFMRWNGGPGDFTDLTSLPGGAMTGPGLGGVAEGDVLRAGINGNTITLYKNNVLAITGHDPENKFTTGQPGLGFFVRPTSEAVLHDFSWSRFKASDL